MADVQNDQIEDVHLHLHLHLPPSYRTDGSLRTYEQATLTDIPSEAPPSYSPIFGEIRGARQSSGSVFEFLKMLPVLLAGTNIPSKAPPSDSSICGGVFEFLKWLLVLLAGTIVIGIFMAIPTAMIVIGAKYKDDCPIENKIPIYLIVGGAVGAVGIVRILLSLCSKARSNDNEEKRRNPIDLILICFLTIWFFCGNVWIYKNYEPNYTGNHDNTYCDKTLYLFAFWLTTVPYIIIGAVCFCVCCVAVICRK